MEVVTKIAPIILALIMLGLGLGLKIEDFTRVLKTPKDFFLGFFSQLIILPIVAYLLIVILKTPPEIAIETVSPFGSVAAIPPMTCAPSIISRLGNLTPSKELNTGALSIVIEAVALPLLPSSACAVTVKVRAGIGGFVLVF